MQPMVVKVLIQFFQVLHLQVVVKVQDTVHLLTDLQEDPEVVVQMQALEQMVILPQ